MYLHTVFLCCRQLYGPWTDCLTDCLKETAGGKSQHYYFYLMWSFWLQHHTVFVLKETVTTSALCTLITTTLQPPPSSLQPPPSSLHLCWSYFTATFRFLQQPSITGHALSFSLQHHRLCLLPTDTRTNPERATIAEVTMIRHEVTWSTYSQADLTSGLPRTPGITRH